ncbi:phosphotransferase family protein [Amycolatopsis ultiminotia]|uniref:Phosphotransferase family protein n=1 Tax=Amycolatopsis ultiminotia TaxID=543629 RepID=A0ABP6UWY0_9PSEU
MNGSSPEPSATGADPGGPGAAAQLAELLREQLPGARDVGVEQVEQVFGGNARQALAGTATWTEPSARRRREPVIMLSRAPGSQVQADPEREYAVLRALSETSVRAPRVFAADRDGAVTGTSSIVLQRMPGRADPVAFLRSRDRARARELTADLARAAAELHAVDVHRDVPGLTERLGGVVSEDGNIDPQSTVAAQIEYWQSVFLGCRLEPLPVLAGLFDWLLDNVPAPARVALVHGDLRPGNFLYEDARLVSLLDWEMVHVGDPAEDLAWIFRPLWSPQRFLDLGSFVRRYEEAGGAPVDRAALLYHRVFAEAKFAAISIRAARAFADGTTTNLRLADRAATVTTSLALALDLAAEWESLPKGALC